MKSPLFVFATLALAVSLTGAISGGMAYADPTLPDPRTTPTTSTQAPSVNLSPPSDAYGTLTITVTGVKSGEWVDVTGQPQGWTQEAPYYKEVQQQGTLPMKVAFEAPSAGWPIGKEYLFQVQLPDGTKVTESFTVAQKTATSSAKTAKPSAKDRAGGLAKTGV